MYWTERHVFACTGSHCNQKGAAQVITRLRFELMRRKLDVKVHLNTCGTIDLCDVGPNLVVYPDNIVYGGLTERDIPEIIAFLQGGPVVERLLVNADAPNEKARERFFRALEDAGNAVSADEAAALAANHGQPDGWLDEQARRGFISRKPNDAGTVIVAMTSKARHRYRIEN